MPLKLDFFYGNEAQQFSFYRIPKTLFTDWHYQSVSIEAKVLYGLLLDRISLSVRNSWMDDERRIYIYFTQEEAVAAMGCGKDKATKLFRELDQNGIGLIERRKQGQGRPARIYVKNFVIPLEPEPSEPDYVPPTNPQATEKKRSMPQADAAVQGAKKTWSEGRIVSGQDDSFSAAIKTDRNKTDWNDTETSSSPLPPPAPQRRQNPAWEGQLEAYRTIIRENISYDILLRDYGCDPEMLDGCVEMMAEVCASTKETIRVNQEDVPTELVRKRFLKLDMTHIAYVLDFLSRSTTPVGNIRGYTLSVLYNAPMSIGHYYTAQVNHDMVRRREVGA